MNYFITYGDAAYVQSREYAIKKAKKYGFDCAIGYSEKDIDSKFAEEHSDILSQKFGGGLWLWKPYFILKTLQEVNEGDVVFYSDAGACFVKPIDKLINQTDDIVLFSGEYLEKWYTKPELFQMMDCISPRFVGTLQVNAAFSVYRKKDKSIVFVKEWLDWCCHDGALILDTIYNENPSTEFEYIEH
ncbi:MAG: hypothetical protein Q4E99_05860 [Bacillota bacterium]|nr:hypothetical protein [Bacillota bacterium]